MKRGAWLTVAALVAFAAIIVARLPASWVLPSGPKAPISCVSTEGSIWSGACSGLTYQHTALGDLSWELKPARLFLGRLAAHVSLAHAAARASGDLELGFGGRISAHGLSAELPLDPKLLPGVPPQLRGSARVELAHAVAVHGIIEELQGTIEAHDLIEQSGRITPLGSYRLSFPGGAGEPVGTLQDIGGPLAVTGTLRLTQHGGYELESQIAARPDAPPELVENLRYLGSPDAAGRRTFSMSGSL